MIETTLDDSCDILVLGSRGRAGRLLRCLCPHPTPGDPLRLRWQSRRGGDGYLAWQPGLPPPQGLRAKTILALWGVTSGCDAALRVNSELACAALELAGQIGAERVLHLSSAAVYGAGQVHPAREDGETRPLSPYGAAKLGMEAAIAAWHRNTPRAPVASVILRLANLAGADMLFGNLGKGGGMVLDRFADGQGPSRSYLAPRDMLAVVAALHRHKGALPPVLNVAGHHAVPMADILSAAGCAFGWRAAPEGALQCLEMESALLDGLTGPLSDSSDARCLVAQWREGQQP
ncbi:NAD-dependent epimerase/dehydratase family protein [Pseudooceanicola algae]|uniref:NAD-dependent epimerase/dehydratase domain-containing protein n=1 Tax=Pseudooceanicola algae TaxID=1537215 RepID=A0A418SB52_9RHOB|nr:NAD(P)-dependent oxidoreductase [Pseudooceanicola algae]QPM91352.1 hypothetical protein PSAL_026050 [Pseudooceanicola algae]